MNILNRLLPFVAGLMLVARADAIVITFDDLQGAGYLPVNYAGLTWGPSWQYYDAVQSPYTAASGAERIYSYSFGGFINFGQSVTFQGSWLASADASQQMWWEGYSNGVKIFESQHYAGGSQLFINLNWVGVDYVKLVDTTENHFILDNITYEPTAETVNVPDASSTSLLLILAALPLIAIRGARSYSDRLRSEAAILSVVRTQPAAPACLAGSPRRNQMETGADILRRRKSDEGWSQRPKSLRRL